MGQTASLYHNWGGIRNMVCFAYLSKSFVLNFSVEENLAQMGTSIDSRRSYHRSLHIPGPFTGHPVPAQSVPTYLMPHLEICRILTFARCEMACVMRNIKRLLISLCLTPTKTPRYPKVPFSLLIHQLPQIPHQSQIISV